MANNNNAACNEKASRIKQAYLAATVLIKQGYSCFPCFYDKTPSTPRGFYNATNDPKLLLVLFEKYPAPLVGVRTGEESGVDILDIDPKNDGMSWLDSNYTSLPKTRIHQTRSGGYHFFFKHNSLLRNSAERIARGVDVRAEGGYIIWWPGVGLPVLNDAKPASWPDFLLEKALLLLSNIPIFPGDNEIFSGQLFLSSAAKCCKSNLKFQ